MPDPVVVPESVPASPVVSSTPAVSAEAITPEPSFSYKEDRSAWVDPSRARAIEAATNRAIFQARQSDERAQRIEAELERVRAVALGVKPHDPAEADIEQTKVAFFQMFPQAQRLFAADPERLEQLLTQTESLAAETRQRWDDHRDKTFEALSTRVAAALGVEALSASAAKKVAAAFRASVPDEGAPEYATWVARYSRGDQKFIDEFAQEFVGDFITPAQRAGFIRPRAHVPSGGASHPVVKTEPKPKPGNLDAAMDRYVATLRERTTA